MSEVTGTSRRTFIGSAGAAAAVVGVATAIPGFAASPASTLTKTVNVSVIDAAKGIFAVHVDERTVEVTDQAFASKLASLIA